MTQELYCMADNIMWSPDLSTEQGPLYLQLVNKMAQDIETGVLKVGEKLPPQRQLAWHLDINLSTVTKAFQEATKRHLITGEVGRGTYILAKSSEAALFNLKQDLDESIIDLSTHVPVAIPNDLDLENTLNEMMQDDEGLSQYLNYHSPASVLRQKISCSRWLNELGYAIGPESCVATTCAQNAMLVSLLSCCRADDTVLVNDLTFPGMKAVAKQLSLKLHGIEMDEQGIIPEALALAIRTTHAKVLVSDPTLQNPTATSMGRQRQQEIIKIIKQHSILFIEEYVIGALSGQSPISTQIKQQSIVITSFAKTVAPGVRFAMIAGEHPILQKILAESHATSWQFSPLMAEIACRWIESGLAKQRMKWQWNEIQKRHRIFKKIFPDSHYDGNKDLCSHVWLPVQGTAEQAKEKCHQLGVEVVPAGLFAVGRNYPQCIRVSLTAAKSRQQLKIGLQRVYQSGLVKLKKGR
jgi:DNA-binding transcriptional MocR family regulator